MEKGDGVLRVFVTERHTVLTHQYVEDENLDIKLGFIFLFFFIHPKINQTHECSYNITSFAEMFVSVREFNLFQGLFSLQCLTVI